MGSAVSVIKFNFFTPVFFCCDLEFMALPASFFRSSPSEDLQLEPLSDILPNMFDEFPRIAVLS